MLYKAMLKKKDEFQVLTTTNVSALFEHIVQTLSEDDNLSVERVMFDNGKTRVELDSDSINDLIDDYRFIKHARDFMNML